MGPPFAVTNPLAPGTPSLADEENRELARQRFVTSLHVFMAFAVKALMKGPDDYGAVKIYAVP
jgi:hypothetical protein